MGGGLQAPERADNMDNPAETTELISPLDWINAPVEAGHPSSGTSLIPAAARSRSG